MVEEGKQNLTSRQPVVVLVGHIDHGKSSILQKIRDFKITEKETGGITQHIGAYEVTMSSEKALSLRESEANRGIPRQARDDSAAEGRRITFIDTPGHEAFTAMRARGAKVADIAILVVAADEGVQPQTKEAIKHIKEAEIPMIVAINKMDKPNANPEKVKRELAVEKVGVESFGGKTPSVNVSAQTGMGIEELLELILLVSEMEELKADILAPASGVIIESYLNSKRGPIATLLLEQGILKKGEVIATPSAFGKVKILENFQGKEITEGRPGMPLVVLGFNEVPSFGERFRAFSSLEKAQAQIETKERKIVPLVKTAEGKEKVLNLILKTDVLGSIEPLEKVLGDLPQEKIKLAILKATVGNIKQEDIELAEAALAQVIGFRVKVENKISRLAKDRKIKVSCFDLIYDLVEYVRGEMKKILEPETVREDLGKLKVLVVFMSKKNRQIVGGRIVEGEIIKGTQIEIFRAASPGKRGEEEEKAGGGKLISLQMNKKEIERGVRGDEVGILYEGDVQIEKGDTLVIYKEEKKKTGL